MAPSQVADEEDGLQIWRIAANALNKQSRTADRGWPPVWGLGRELKTITLKNQVVMKYSVKPRSWTDSLA
jgi:hypothetical protein